MLEIVAVLRLHLLLLFSLILFIIVYSVQIGVCPAVWLPPVQWASLKERQTSRDDILYPI